MRRIGLLSTPDRGRRLRYSVQAVSMTRCNRYFLGTCVDPQLQVISDSAEKAANRTRQRRPLADNQGSHHHEARGRPLRPGFQLTQHTCLAGVAVQSCSMATKKLSRARVV